MGTVRYSIIVPVYRNEASIHRLVEVLEQISGKLTGLEVVFVVDGSPDNSLLLLQKGLDSMSFAAQLIVHARNFGSFPAVRTGLEHARGIFFGVMAADLQEPPDLLLRFFSALENDECDVAIGTRESREDPFFSRVASQLFWVLYRSIVIKDIPKGGVDVFGCNLHFRDQLLLLNESRSSLVGLIYWLGFRREEFTYSRLARQEGKSSWSFRRKMDYMLDSIYAFTDFPIRLLFALGILGIFFSLILGVMVVLARLIGQIQVPGYVPTVLIVLFFGALNLIGMGIVGNYAWRAFENTKQRPISVVLKKFQNDKP